MPHHLREIDSIINENLRGKGSKIITWDTSALPNHQKGPNQAHGERSRKQQISKLKDEVANYITTAKSKYGIEIDQNQAQVPKTQPDKSTELKEIFMSIRPDFTSILEAPTDDPNYTHKTVSQFSPSKTGMSLRTSSKMG